MSNDAGSRCRSRQSTAVRNSIGRIAGNAASLLTSDVVNKAATFIVYALVGRYLGTTEFAQMSLALSLFYTFGVFAGAGLKTLITREVATDSTKTDQYLVNGSIVVIVCSLLSIGGLLLLVRLMNYSADAATFIVLLGLGLPPLSLSSVCQGIFQAREQMHYIAYANALANVAKVGLAFLILANGYGLYPLVILLVASHLLVAGVMWWLMIRHITRPRARIDFGFCWRMIKSSSTFLGIEGVIGIWASLNILLLSKLATEVEVGLYSAASQLIGPVTLVLASMALSLFPIMCRRSETSVEGPRAISQSLIELMLSIAIPVAVGLCFLGDSALLLIYKKEEFALASGALQIMVWSLIPIALDHVLGQVLLATLLEKVTLRIVVIDVLVNLVLGLLLVRRFGLNGAAMAALLTRIIDFIQHYVPVSKMMPRMALGRAAWKPIVASACMAVLLATVRSLGTALTVVSGGALYVGVLFALTVWSAGGLRQFKSKCLYLSGQGAWNPSGQEMSEMPNAE